MGCVNTVRVMGSDQAVSHPYSKRLLRIIVQQGGGRCDEESRSCLARFADHQRRQQESPSRQEHDESRRQVAGGVFPGGRNSLQDSFLGTGESGKSTVVKQAKLIYNGGGISNKEKEEYWQAIRRNAIESIQALTDARETLDIPLANGDDILAVMER